VAVTASAGRGPLVRIVDRALPPPLFRRLARAVRGLGGENLARTYQTTFWFGLGAPAALPEVAILALGDRLPEGVAGVEWWLSRMRTSDVQVDFHQDRDEVLFQRTGRVRHPRFSAVLYLNRCRGGLLAVVDAAASDANPARAPDRFDADLVRPWPNRLAIFPGDATHGVLDARCWIPSRRLATPSLLRLALVMNGWERRPAEVPEFAGSRWYAGLRIG
jgi:hypothetical protein